MRRLDKWLGVPLCWLLSVLSFPFVLTAGAAPSRRILCIELAEMGCMVLADPALKALCAQAEYVAFLTFGASRDGLELTRRVDREDVFTLRTDNLWSLLTDCGRFVLWARRRGFDTVVDFELFTRLSALLARASGAGRRIGFHGRDDGLYRGKLINHPITFQAHRHISNNYLALAAAAYPDAATEKDLPPPGIDQVSVSPEQCEAALRRLQQQLPEFALASHQLLLLNPNAGDLLPQRRWPIEHYLALAHQALAAWPNLYVAVMGGPGDRRGTAEFVVRVANRRCGDIAGLFPIADLPALFSLSTLLVSNDSGPAHFAAISPLPVIALFGPESPERYRPLGNVTALSAGLTCSPCIHAHKQRRSDCRDNRCMQAIGVDQVFWHVQRILDAMPGAVSSIPNR
ncbi:MAG TPA: glycosyltransferase family 9 protein [Azonexus sp.]|nr:glycosyltransferase family 9 protein [Azonexus sp.]